MTTPRQPHGVGHRRPPTRTSDPHPRSGAITRRRPASASLLPWIILGIIALALNLRGPIIAPTAVLADLQADTGLNAIGAGLLTGVPVLIFALATPLATRAIGRFGAELTVVACLSGVLAGTVLRSVGPGWLVLTGTGLIGIAITLGNIVVPVIIRREVPQERVSLTTGLYSATMNVGSMITLVATAPLAAAVGWRWAIALWAVLAVLALGVWLVILRRRGVGAGGRPEREAGLTTGEVPAVQAAEPAPSPRLRRVVWLLVITFSAQSGAYYGITTWLPSILSDERGLNASQAGATASLFQVAAIVGAFGVPVLAARTRSWVPMAAVAVLWISLPLGMVLAPGGYAVWAITGGAAQGGGFTAIFSIVAHMARSDRQAASASATVQTGGYLSATLVPPVAGWLHTVTGGWTVPLVLLCAITVVFALAGLAASRAAGERPGPTLRQREVE